MNAKDNNVQTFTDASGTYDVHYSIFNSSFIAPDVAELYKIVRSPETALLNISVLKHQKDGSKKGVKAAVSGNEYDLIRYIDMAFFEIEEKNAIYYLSSLKITHKTTIYFTINVQPTSDLKPFTVKFNKLLYKDEKD